MALTVVLRDLGWDGDFMAIVFCGPQVHASEAMVILGADQNQKQPGKLRKQGSKARGQAQESQNGRAAGVAVLLAWGWRYPSHEARGAPGACGRFPPAFLPELLFEPWVAFSLRSCCFPFVGISQTAMHEQQFLRGALIWGPTTPLKGREL